MSAQERTQAGIYEALLNRPNHDIEEPEGSGSYRTIDHRIPEDATREEFFFKESIRVANAIGATSILVLCGDMHVEFLRQLLESDKRQVDTNHELIAKKYCFTVAGHSPI
jgi:hypothetical protein